MFRNHLIKLEQTQSKLGGLTFSSGQEIARYTIDHFDIEILHSCSLIAKCISKVKFCLSILWWNGLLLFSYRFLNELVMPMWGLVFPVLLVLTVYLHTGFLSCIGFAVGIFL